ncbi:hypothetical protein FEM33_13695 [Dyadobacter flavalbus]|uniref:Nitrogen fixation protein FixH n=1 Tax=Dyadobacter flavalbus TaxID=2579942 RepID=A0A5M8QSS9_9BACT|nr:FixH family protein [Dyadobacter flavalbus]KAA6439317.1 hypothetical protein FEM33_13695 [Dyadobacter flavalbus]
MKINWGVGIVTLYLGFVAMILLLVTMSVGQKIDLATEHYYEEELQFQDKIDKVKRAQALSEPLDWKVDEHGITVDYPSDLEQKNLSGQIRLYCPSNDRNDRQYAVSAAGGVQFISAADIPDGTYRLQIDWKSDDQTFWNEGVVTISHLK